MTPTTRGMIPLHWTQLQRQAELRVPCCRLSTVEQDASAHAPPLMRLDSQVVRSWVGDVATHMEHVRRCVLRITLGGDDTQCLKFLFAVLSPKVHGDATAEHKNIKDSSLQRKDTSTASSFEKGATALGYVNRSLVVSSCRHSRGIPFNIPSRLSPPCHVQHFKNVVHQPLLGGS